MTWPYDSECPACGRWDDVAAQPTVIGPNGPQEATIVCENCLHQWEWVCDDAR